MEELINEIIIEWNGKTISSPEQFENELRISFERLTKELNSGRKMYQRGREDMKRELIEEIRSMPDHGIQYPFEPDGELIKKFEVFNLIKNNK